MTFNKMLVSCNMNDVTDGWSVGLEFNNPVNTITVMTSWPVYLTTLFLGSLILLSDSSALVYILLPETDTCPSWISSRKRMTTENISRSISMKKCCQAWQGSNLWADHLSDVHPTEPTRLADIICLWHYENTPIQINWKFYHQKNENFQRKNLFFSYFC